MRRWSMALLLLLLPGGVAAGQSILRTIDLGDGMRVESVSVASACIYTPGPCFLWRAVGLDIARRDALLVARTFARVPGTPRVVAAVPYRSDGIYSGVPGDYPRPPAYRRPGILYTDDQGANWRAGIWPSRNEALAMAFGSDGALGVAVGPSQGIWITTDQGVHWTERSSSAGRSYVDVAVTGNTTVIVDSAGTAWRSRDRGFALDTVASEVSEPLSIEGDSIAVVTASRIYRVAADGSVRDSAAH